jgi:hypothetical protein
MAQTTNADQQQQADDHDDAQADRATDQPNPRVTTFKPPTDHNIDSSRPHNEL